MTICFKTVAKGEKHLTWIISVNYEHVKMPNCFGTHFQVQYPNSDTSAISNKRAHCRMKILN